MFNKDKIRKLYCFWVAAMVCISSPAFSASDLPDDQKKKIVYEMYAEYKKDFPKVQDMTPKEAMERLASGSVVFIDTRKAEEIAVSTLPDAVTREAFLKSPDKYKGKTLVAYCTISYRSGKFAEEMAEKGITVYNLTGGILAWTLEGGKVYDDKGVTRRIHVYGKKWNYPPQGYEAAIFGLLDRLF